MSSYEKTYSQYELGQNALANNLSLVEAQKAAREQAMRQAAVSRSSSLETNEDVITIPKEEDPYKFSEDAPLPNFTTLGRIAPSQASIREMPDYSSGIVTLVPVVRCANLVPENMSKKKLDKSQKLTNYKRALLGKKPRGRPKKSRPNYDEMISDLMNEVKQETIGKHNYELNNHSPIVRSLKESTIEAMSIRPNGKYTSVPDEKNLTKKFLSSSALPPLPALNFEAEDFNSTPVDPVTQSPSTPGNIGPSQADVVRGINPMPVGLLMPAEIQRSFQSNSVEGLARSGHGVQIPTNPTSVQVNRNHVRETNFSPISPRIQHTDPAQPIQAERFNLAPTTPVVQACATPWNSALIQGGLIKAINQNGLLISTPFQSLIHRQSEVNLMEWLNQASIASGVQDSSSVWNPMSVYGNALGGSIPTQSADLMQARPIPGLQTAWASVQDSTPVQLNNTHEALSARSIIRINRNLNAELRANYPYFNTMINMLVVNQTINSQQKYRNNQSSRKINKCE